MPRFAVAAALLLIGIIGVAAAAMWYSGWSPGLRVLEAASASGSAEPDGQQDLVARASAAIRAHDIVAVRRYLAEAGDPDAADAEGETLLNKTVLHGTPEILDVLLAAGADPNLTGKNDLGPLTLAALAGRHAMLERLMRANSAEPNKGTAANTGTAASNEQAHVQPASKAPPATAATSADAVPPAPPPAPAAGTDVAAPPAPASSAGEGPLPTERHASMAGLSITPVSRPPSGAATAAPPASGAREAPPPAAPTSGPAAATGTGAGAGSVPHAWASAAQRRLGELGYYKGPVTGFAGPLTAEAVKRYQAAAGLPQDGVVSADLLRRIGAKVDAPAPAPSEAPAPAAAPLPPASATVPDQRTAPTPASSRGLQEVRNALGQQFNSATRPDALRQHCQANTNAWIYDEAIGRSLFCRDVIGSPPH